MQNINYAECVPETTYEGPGISGDYPHPADRNDLYMEYRRSESIYVKTAAALFLTASAALFMALIYLAGKI